MSDNVTQLNDKGNPAPRALEAKITELMDEFVKENDMTYYEVIGVLEYIKSEILEQSRI